MASSNVLNTMFGFAPGEAVRDTEPPENTSERGSWDPRSFGEQQIRSLVHQLFFQTGIKSPRQVVFTAADEKANVGEICLQAAHALSDQTFGSVCIVKVSAQLCHSRSSHFDNEFQRYPYTPMSGRERFDWLRDSAIHLSKKLWLVPSEAFLRDEKALSAAWLRSRLDELRLDFDYTLFHAPAADQSSDALLLGHLCDGVVLILSANSTRRVAAKKVKERLYAANARLLGTVLSDRQFPIPERIYRRL